MMPAPAAVATASAPPATAANRHNVACTDAASPRKFVRLRWRIAMPAK